MPAIQTANDLRGYLYRRLQYINQCYAEIQSKLSDDANDLLQKIDDGDCNVNDPVVGEIIYNLDFVVGYTFRYTMLVGVCSFLEESVKAITELVLKAEYKAKINAHKRVSWLDKHIRALSEDDSKKWNTIQSNLNTFRDLVTLRNCVVHTWGKVAGTKKPSEVRRAADRIETADISADGYLIFGDQVVPTAIIAAENITEHLIALM